MLARLSATPEPTDVEMTRAAIARVSKPSIVLDAEQAYSSARDRRDDIGRAATELAAKHRGALPGHATLEEVNAAQVKLSAAKDETTHAKHRLNELREQHLRPRFNDAVAPHLDVAASLISQAAALAMQASDIVAEVRSAAQRAGIPHHRVDRIYPADLANQLNAMARLVGSVKSTGSRGR